MLDRKAGDRDDETVDPRFGRVGRQVRKDRPAYRQATLAPTTSRSVPLLFGVPACVFALSIFAIGIGRGFGVRYLIARALGLYTGAGVAWGPDDFAFYIQVGNAWR